MSFGEPILLLGLVLVPLAALAYLAMQGRKRREAAAAEREQVAAGLRRAGADHVVLSTEGDWLREFAHHLRRGEAAVRAGSPSRAAVVARLHGEGTVTAPSQPGAQHHHPDGAA